MRWKSTKKGDSRIITKFLFLPRAIAGETRWLEKATWKQEYWGVVWLDLCWVND